MRVSAQSLILKASDGLTTCLVEAGKKGHFPATSILFHEQGDNVGIFLVVKGKVCLSMTSMPMLNRLFGSGSLLGLPSTFTGRPYSLTATAITEADVVHLAPGDWLRLMVERPELCREAMEMLSREMSFIQSALAERRKQVGSARNYGGDVAVL